MLRSLPASFLLVAALGAPASAQELFIDVARGNDSNPGTAALPVKSIARGIALAGNGSIVSVYPGVYGQAQSGEVLPIAIGVTVQHNGLLLRALGPVVLDLGGAASTVMRLGAGAAGVRITGFMFRNSDRTGWWTRTIELDAGAQNVEIDRCHFDQVNRGIVLWERSPDVTGCKVHHNLFTDLGNDAIDDYDLQGTNQTFNNTIVGSIAGPNYVGVLVESPTAVVANNLVVGMRDGFLTGLSASATSFRNNDTWQCTSAFAGKLTSAPPTNTNVDPQFVNRAGRDFRLMAASPLLEGGDPQLPMAADLDRNPCPTDSDRDLKLLPDVGAYEQPIAQTTFSYNRTSGQLTVSLTTRIATPTIAAIFFALDEAVTSLGGVGPFLLDLGKLLPYTTAPTTPPITLNAVLTGIPPGIALAMQGVVLDPGKGQLHLTSSARLQW